MCSAYRLWYNNFTVADAASVLLLASVAASLPHCVSVRQQLPRGIHEAWNCPATKLGDQLEWKGKIRERVKRRAYVTLPATHPTGEGKRYFSLKQWYMFLSTNFCLVIFSFVSYFRVSTVFVLDIHSIFSLKGAKTKHWLIYRPVVDFSQRTIGRQFGYFKSNKRE